MGVSPKSANYQVGNEKDITRKDESKEGIRIKGMHDDHF